MTAYLVIGGPKHGEIVEVQHGATIMVPDESPDFDLAAVTGQPVAPTPAPRMVTYRSWSIPSDILPDAPPSLEVMKLESMPDARAMLELGNILRPRFNAIEKRLAPKEANAFRDFLDQVDAHGRIPPGAWRVPKARTPPIA